MDYLVSLLECYPTLKYWSQLLRDIILIVPQSSVNILFLEALGINENDQKVKEWIVGNCMLEYIYLAKTEVL